MPIYREFKRGLTVNIYCNHSMLSLMSDVEPLKFGKKLTVSLSRSSKFPFS